VRGKEFWRTTSSAHIQSIKPTPAVIRPLALLEKLVQGEDPHPALFDAIEQAIVKPDQDEQTFEIQLVAQILYHLGYLKELDLTLGKTALVKAVNEGIQHSHLL
jgi:hypothetical protein